MEESRIKVLLIEDDEDDYVLVRDLLSEIPARKYVLEWVRSYHAALHAMECGRHDICLLDYHLGSLNGLNFLQEAALKGLEIPIIFLTGCAGQYLATTEGNRTRAAKILGIGLSTLHRKLKEIDIDRPSRNETGISF